MDSFEFVMWGGETKRFHTWPVLQTQRVDAHSWNVVAILHQLVGDNIRPHLLLAGLYHDIPEQRGGDLPSPGKRGMEAYFPDFREKWNDMERDQLRLHGTERVRLEWENFLTPNETRLLKLADNLQGALYCIRERMLGNKMIATPFQNFRSYIGEIIDFDNKVEADFYAYIDDMWEQANGGC